MQKSAEAIVVGRTSRWKDSEASLSNEGLNVKLIEILLIKITTKSQIEILLPEPKLIRIFAADCYSFCPPYSQTAC
jgi:hypothetical protein